MLESLFSKILLKAQYTIIKNIKHVEPTSVHLKYYRKPVPVSRYDLPLVKLTNIRHLLSFYYQTYRIFVLLSKLNTYGKYFPHSFGNRGLIYEINLNP